MEYKGIRVDLSIHPDVDLAKAVEGLRRATGSIAVGLRALALRQAEDRVRAARRIRNGAYRHAATKTRRDTLRRLRKLEIQRRGWNR